MLLVQGKCIAYLGIKLRPVISIRRMQRYNLMPCDVVAWREILWYDGQYDRVVLDKRVYDPDSREDDGVLRHFGPAESNREGSFVQSPIRHA
jgi:hypothetical protein